MATAEENLILRMRARGARQSARDVDEVAKSTRRVGDNTARAGRNARRAASGFAAFNGRLKVIGRGLTDAGGALTRSLTVPLLGAGIASGKFAFDFDRQMRNVNSIAQLPERQFLRLEKRVLRMAGPVAQAPQTLALGLYDLVSSGFDANESMLVLRESARAATAGLTTTEVASAAVAAVLNAYRRPAADAAAVSDTLFRTVDRGVLSFGALATNLGPILPTAVTLGVRLEELGASISTLTKAGIPVDETMTAINGAMVAFIKPSKDMAKAFETLGVSGAEDLIKRFGGLQGAMEAVIGTTDGSSTSVGQLFRNIRAQRAVFGLTGKNIKSARADLSEFKDTTGATDRALRQQRKSMSFQWNRLMAQLKALAIEVGQELMPAMRDGVGVIRDLMKWFKGLSPETRKWVLIIGLALGVLGPLLTMLGMTVLAVAALSSPVTLVVLGIAALAAGFAYAYAKSETFRDIVGKLWSVLKHTPMVWLARTLITHANDIVNVFTAMPGAIKAAFTSTVNFMIDRVNNIIDVINAAIGAFNKLPGPDIGTVGRIGHIGEGPGKPAPPPFAPPGGLHPFGATIGPALPSPAGRGEVLGPPAPTPAQPRRRVRNPLTPSGPFAPIAGASSDGGTIVLESHTTVELDGEKVGKKIHRRSVKAKAVR